MRRADSMVMNGRTRILHTAAAGLCVLMPLVIAVGAPTAVRAPVSLLFLCLAPGCAVAGLVRLRFAVAEIALVAGVGLAVVTIGAQLMMSLHAWHPELATGVLAILCLAALLYRLLPEVSVESRLDARHGRAPLSHRVETWFGPAWIGHLAVLMAVLVLWVVALRQTTVGQLSGYGLLAGLPITYYLALVLLVAGFSSAVMARSPRPVILGAYAVLLILLLHGTTAVLYPEPRYTWVYKHLGVIDYIASHGSVDRDIDIYQNWPGFFALNAWFSQIAAWRPIDYAAWAQVFFEVLNICALTFALRGLTRDRRQTWMAVWIFLWANWIGQDYLSPQAFGFFEAVVVIGLVLRTSQRQWPERTRLAHRLASILTRLQGGSLRRQPLTDARTPLHIGPRSALVLGGTCFVADVISHQLTPVILCAAVAWLAVTRWCRPVWIPVLMSAVTLGWIALAWPFVSAHFQLFNFDIPRAQTPPVLTGSPTLGGVGFVRLSELLITGFVLVLAASEAFVQWRDRVLPFALLGLAGLPFVIAVAQSYGGEATLRAYLFALPWLAFLAASALLSPVHALSKRMRRWEPPVTLMALTAGLAVPFLFAYFGQESQNFVSRDDVAANLWYASHAPTGAVIAFAAPNSPSRLTGSYATMNVADAGSTLTDDVKLLGHQFTDADLPRVENLLAALHGTARYLVVTPSETNYLLLYGLVPPGWTDNLVATLRASHDFRLVFSSGSAVVFQFTRAVPG